MSFPVGVVNTQSPCGCVDTMYPAFSSMGMDNKFAIPLSFSHTLNSPNHPGVLVLVVPALQHPVMITFPLRISDKNSFTKKVWYVAQLSKYTFHQSSACGLLLLLLTLFSISLSRSIFLVCDTSSTTPVSFPFASSSAALCLLALAC